MPDIQTRILRIRKHIARRRTRIEEQLAAGREHETVRRLGELLKAAEGFTKGMTEVTVTDWYATPPQPVTIPVDPALDRFANAEHYFKQARKRERSIPHQQKRLQKTLDLLHKVEKIERDLDAETPDVEAAAAQLIGLGFARFFPEENRPVEEQDETERLRTFTSSEGFTIHVGRSAEENDYLTFRVGRGKDMWLHVSGFHGSHVIIKLPKGQECPRRTLREAAALAIHYSKARGNFRQEVTCGPVCNVRKAARRQPGKVTIANPKYVKSDKKALEDVMKEGLEP